MLMDRRFEIASRVVGVFEDLPEVAAVFPRGSLAARSLDEYSDIDIGVDVSGHSNAEFAMSVRERMANAFDLHFSDWATSLMPDTYVETFYIRGLPIFGNVDIEVVATPHHATLMPGDVVRDSTAGFLKVWAIDTKYLLCGKEGIGGQIEQFYARVFGKEPAEQHSPEHLLSTVLDELEFRADEQFDEFIRQCREVYAKRPQVRYGRR